MKVRRIGVLSLGKILGLTYAALGLLIGIVVALFSVLGGMIAANQQGANAGIPAVFMGVGAIIFAPLFYGLFGFLAGILSAALFNVAVNITGGLEIEFGE